MQTTIDDTRVLPRLKPGLTLLETPSTRSQALHAVVVKRLVDAAGETLWIDSRGNASTYVLDGIARDERILRELRIARAFTAYQHYALVRAVVRRASRETDLVVVPCVAALYRDDDLPEYRRSQLLESAVATLGELGTSLEIPIVVTEPGPNDALRAILDAYLDHEIGCAKTDFGYRFETDGFRTTVYRCDGWWQTTIPYWVELLGAAGASERATVTVEDLRPAITA